MSATALLTRVVIGTAALSLGLATPAFAKADGGSAAAVTLAEAAATLQPNRYLWEADAAAGPVGIVVSIADQRMYVYRGQTLVAVSSVSTGKEGKETPVGVFTILQKKAMNYSNLYDNAPMPFMQRLTWDGIAIHAGKNPGAPASHGCIRVPAEFAKRLYAMTELGAAVEVTDLPWVEGTPAPITDAERTRMANGGSDPTLGEFLASR